MPNINLEIQFDFANTPVRYQGSSVCIKFLDVRRTQRSMWFGHSCVDPKDLDEAE